MSDQDPRIRELTYRLMAMAPDAPPFPEETVMKASNTKQRSPAMVWVAAALAVVLLVGVPLLLFRGSDEAPTTTVAAGDTTTTTVDGPTTTVQETSTVTDPIREVPPTSGDCADDYVALDPASESNWYVFHGCDGSGMEGTLVPQLGGVKSGELARDLLIAIAGSLMAPEEILSEAGYSKFWIEDIDVLQPDSLGTIGVIVGVAGDVQIDLPDVRLEPGMANASASAASTQLIAQLASAVFQFPEVGTVTFTFEGNCDAFWNWLQRDCTTVTRTEWASDDATAGIASWLQGQSVVPPTTTTEAVTSDTILPGDPFDIGPASGDVIAVVGVAHDDVLWLRDGPGTGYEPLLGLDPLADNLVATGRHRLLTSSIWDEVTVDGVTGWVSSSYVGYLGYTEDLTTVVEDRVGVALETETMQQIGQIVAEAMASADEGGSRIVTSVAPSVGDLGEITMDVWGLADDAQLGWRLHVFATPSASGEGFVLKSVEATGICGRGVTAEGWCI